VSIQLRDYQQELLDKCIAKLKGGCKRPLLVLPTGGGKTACASELVRRSFDKGKSSIFICHRQELLNQTYKTYMKNGITPGVIKGGITPDYKNPIQIASVNT
jgi:superfamily II DNA or RNA helicase